MKNMSKVALFQKEMKAIQRVRDRLRRKEKELAKAQVACDRERKKAEALELELEWQFCQEGGVLLEIVRDGDDPIVHVVLKTFNAAAGYETVDQQSFGENLTVGKELRYMVHYGSPGVEVLRRLTQMKIISPDVYSLICFRGVYFEYRRGHWCEWFRKSS